MQNNWAASKSGGRNMSKRVFSKVSLICKESAKTKRKRQPSLQFCFLGLQYLFLDFTQLFVFTASRLLYNICYQASWLFSGCWYTSIDRSWWENSKTITVGLWIIVLLRNCWPIHFGLHNPRRRKARFSFHQFKNVLWLEIRRGYGTHHGWFYKLRVDIS